MRKALRTGTQTMGMVSALALGSLLAARAPLCYAEDAKKKDMVPLPIKLPKPVPPGTPLDFLLGANVEEPSDEPRPIPLVPKGTKNLTLKKKVTSSAKRVYGGSLDMIVDGDKEARSDSAVELPTGLQWVQIDLGAECPLHYLVAWHYHLEPMVFLDVVVQVANDPNFVKDVKTLYNNDMDNSAGLGIGKNKEYIEDYQGRQIGAKGVKARYVRLYSDGSTWRDPVNFYTEIEVWG